LGHKIKSFSIFLSEDEGSAEEDDDIDEDDEDDDDDDEEEYEDYDEEGEENSQGEDNDAYEIIEKKDLPEETSNPFSKLVINDALMTSIDQIDKYLVYPSVENLKAIDDVSLINTLVKVIFNKDTQNHSL
jgi:hypothetical protein